MSKTERRTDSGLSKLLATTKLCEGRIETPDSALVFQPAPRTCHYETGLTMAIKQLPLIRTLFATLNETKRILPGVIIRSQMVKVLRLNLIQLLGGPVGEGALAKIAKTCWIRY